MGIHDFKYNNVPFFAKKIGIPQCMCQVSLRLKEVQMGVHDFKYNNVPFFAKKIGNINTSIFAAPKQALVPASRYYRDVTWSYHNACAKFY